MVLQALVAEVRDLSESEAGNWVVRLMAIADGLDRELADPAELAALADRLIDVAETVGARSVTGVSAGGDRLAGAMAVRSAGRVRLVDGTSTNDPILVVETLLATGTQLLATARTLRAGGVGRVVGAAVLADPTALELARRELGDQVVALEVI